MTNYINMIYDDLEGDTPREKYESLQKLKKLCGERQGTIDFAFINFNALSKDPSPKETQGICAAVASTLRKSISAETAKYNPE